MTSKALEILGLKLGNRTEDEIKKQYRKLAKKYHPDRAKTKELKEEYTNKFQEISKAHEFLTKNQQNNITNSRIIISPPIIETIVSITLKELYNGTIKNISINCQVICDKCPTEIINCDACRGQGCLITWNGMACICNQCQGLGKITANCHYCHGNKVYATNKELEINIKQEQIILIKDQGHEIPGSSINGDIKIIIHVDDYENYKLTSEGQLILNLDLDLKTILLGKTLTYIHLDESIIELDIPECCDTNYEFSLPKLGFNENDLLVRVNSIKFPKSLSENDKNLLSQMEF
jgi:DnaJ-class molecular chaperone